MSDKVFLPVITGPTASGKTACAVEVCRMIGGEVVSADSMQVFSGMEILSAAPSFDEQKGIAHHMIGIAQPTQPFSAAKYRELAIKCVGAIVGRGKQPLMCGGTGLYIDAVTRPMSFSETGDDALRTELHELADKPGGRDMLHKMLEDVDPESAARLHRNDVRRVVRAIEVYKLTGVTMTEQAKRDHERKGDFDEMIFALDWPRDEIYSRIDARVDEMIKNGLLKEVRSLMKQAEEQPTAVQAIGYKEIAAALRGDVSLKEAVIKMKQATRNYAKRQVTWLKRDERTIWIKADGRNKTEIAAEICDKIWRR